VRHGKRVETHQLCAREIRGYEIVGQNHVTQLPTLSLKRPVTFHPDDGIRDSEMNGHRAVRIPMKKIGCSDPMSIRIRAQQSWQFYVDGFIEIRQEKCQGGE
jgi:hypothetical protein